VVTQRAVAPVDHEKLQQGALCADPSCPAVGGFVGEDLAPGHDPGRFQQVALGERSAEAYAPDRSANRQKDVGLLRGAAGSFEVASRAGNGTEQSR
jgi:hypothetical protein